MVFTLTGSVLARLALPTYGLTPIDGIVPLSGTYVDVVGPLARTVRDAAIALP